LALGSKLPQMQNLGGGFVVFFLGAKIATLRKLGVKIAIKPTS